MASKMTNRSNKSHRRRSSSTSDITRAYSTRRSPAVDTSEERDVSVLVCMELSSAIILTSDLNVGKFLDMAKASKRDLCISDSTILVSAAILQEVGANESSKRLLNRSRTLTDLYEKMNLNDRTVRNMYVTTLFALSPEFVKMIEGSIRIALDRAEALVKVPHSGSRVRSAFAQLFKSGQIADSEAIRAAASVVDPIVDLESGVSLRTRHNSGAIYPSDSASNLGIATRKNTGLTDADILAYIKRRKTGLEPDFEQVFPRAPKPIEVRVPGDRSGVGYKSVRKLNAEQKVATHPRLGAQTVTSYNLDTGKAHARRPRVDDFVESESVSPSAIKEIDSLLSDVTLNPRFYTATNPKYEPTDTLTLPSEQVNVFDYEQDSDAASVDTFGDPRG